MARRLSHRIRDCAHRSQTVQWYARGDISVKEAAQRRGRRACLSARAAPKFQPALSTDPAQSGLYRQFDWNGKTFDGRHEALVSIDLWEQVQNVIDGRLQRNPS